jgi:hypothetical protein
LFGLSMKKTFLRLLRQYEKANMTTFFYRFDHHYQFLNDDEHT